MLRRHYKFKSTKLDRLQTSLPSVFIQNIMNFYLRYKVLHFILIPFTDPKHSLWILISVILYPSL